MIVEDQGARDGIAIGRPEFSVVITCFYEEDSIEEFHERLTRSLSKIGRSFEIIFVNDGSEDRTFEKLKSIFENDPNVSTVIDLFRNAGQVCAMSAGIAHARGEHFVFMDSDLQLDPEELPLLFLEFDKGNDIVSGFRKTRRDPIFRRSASWFANVIMRKVSGHRLSDFGCTFKVYNGSLVRAFGFGPFKKWKTAYVFAQARQVSEVAVTHHPRKYGDSGWTIKKLQHFFFDHLVGVSRQPFQFIGIVCITVAFLFFLRIVLAWTVPIRILPEVTPGLILNAVAGFFLVLVGILAAIGEYVMRVFVASQKDPIYVIREIFQKP